MSPRVGASVSVLVLLLSAAASAEETLLGCRAIESDAERLACYDRTLDRLSEGQAPEQPSAVARAPASAGAAPTASAPAASAAQPAAAEPGEVGLRDRLFGRSATSTEEALRDAYGVEKVDSLSEEVASVRRTADRKLEVTLANGQVWRQTDGEKTSIRAGDTIVIQAGAFGAYYLRREGQGRSVRVKRIE